MSTYPARNKNSKKIAKKVKKLKNTIVASFQAKIFWGRQRKRENKKNKKNKIVSMSSCPTRNKILKKIAKKLKKIKKHHCCFFPSQNKYGKAEKERKKKQKK